MPITVPISPADEDLNQLEKDIRQLKIEYEQYFGGGRSRPPADTEWRVELMVKKYSEKGSRLNAAQRFRFSSLTQTYAKYREIFRKRLKQREEGTVTRHYGAAAREIEAKRRVHEKHERPHAGVVSSVNFNPVSDSARDLQKAHKLYEVFKDAKEKAGESIKNLNLDSFENFLSQKTRELRAGNAKADVEFAVEVEDGRVKLKARIRDSHR